MGFWSSIMGRSTPAKADLDALFAVPNAALTLEAGGGFLPTGSGSVCYRASEGGAFNTTQSDVVELLDADDGPKVERSEDSYGFTWLYCQQGPDDLSGLVTDLHAINTSLQDNGFGTALLCSLVNFRGTDGQPLAMVYLYKQGTFYPFAPRGANKRDNSVELQVRGLIENDVPLEKDLQRWLGVWGAPGL
ncbi:hypothetical protein MU582_13355 [Nocardioidaceae bacterium SCSIO 66511]|nr:hypothetical protein MU582_13355 [Nocardioidaceae bacterium SCSIO 66511]